MYNYFKGIYFVLKILLIQQMVLDIFLLVKKVDITILNLVLHMEQKILLVPIMKHFLQHQEQIILMEIGFILFGLLIQVEIGISI